MPSRRKQWYMQGRLGRKPRNALPLRKRFLIVTNGETEQLYFNKFRTTTGPVVIIVKKPIDPRRLVERASAERATRQHKGMTIDETWVVMDRDTNPENPKDVEHFDEAMGLAKKAKINVAYSNDCFELWLVLHFQDLTASTHRDDLCKLLDKHLGKKYKKSETGKLHDSIKHLRADAIDRCEKLEKKSASTDKPWHTNPSTTVHQLIQQLMKDPGLRD